MSLIEQHSHQTGILPLCEALEIPRASFYRQQARGSSTAPLVIRPRPEHSLSDAEQQQVLATLHEPRFVDLAPSQVYAQLLEQGQYLCSIRTMYRLLAANNEVRERRAVASHVVYTKPELLATRPNEVWSWDITKLKGPVKWTYYYLYVILDIFSRYVVGWIDRRSRVVTVGQTLDHGKLCQTKHSRGSIDASCGSWVINEIQGGRPIAIRPGCHENTQPPARFQ